MADLFATLAAVLAAIFGGILWHRRGIDDGRRDGYREAVVDLEQRSAVVRAAMSRKDKSIDEKTAAKIKTITAAAEGDGSQPTTDDANELNKDATGGPW
jgi:hypothetical protein